MNGQIVTVIGLIVVALGSYLSVYGQMLVRKSDAEKNRAEAEKSRIQLDTQLLRMEGKLGSADSTQRYVDAVRNLSRQLAAQKTANSTEKYFGAEEERKKLREEVRQVNSKIHIAHNIRIQPVADFIIAKFDDWIASAEKHGMKLKVSKAEVPSVTVDGTPSSWIRNVAFADGSSIRLHINPAVVFDGKLHDAFRCMIPMYSKEGGSTVAGNAFMLEIDDKQYHVRNSRPEIFSYKSYDGESENPVEDKKLLETLNEALDQIIAFALEQVSH